jgi:hypothetical protein
MGGIASAASYGSAAAALYNPASTADIEDLSVSLSKMTWLVETDYNSGAVVKNFQKWGYIGINFIYVDYGDMLRTENQAEFEDGIYTGRSNVALDLGTFGASDLALGLSYARQITDRLQVGGNLRYVSETLDNATTGNWSLDIGTVYYTRLKSFRIAMVGRNFGPDATFAEYNDRIGFPAVKVKMPMSFTLGGAVDILEGEDDSPHLWTVAAEFIHPNDGPEKVNLGTEYNLMNLLTVRGGYRFNYDEEGVTLGGGLRLVTSSLALYFNYAYIDFGRFDSIHMFTLGFGME